MSFKGEMTTFSATEAERSPLNIEYYMRVASGTEAANHVTMSSCTEDVRKTDSVDTQMQKPSKEM